MSNLGLMWKNRVSFLLALPFLLLLTSSMIGCSSSDAPVFPVSAVSPTAPEVPVVPEVPATPTFQQNIEAAVDAAMAAADNKRGISVAVYDGTTMWTYAVGYATGDYGTTTGTAMTTDTPSYAYSITKTLVSALVLTQIENGLYSLTDTVEGLLSGHADYASFNLTNINHEATVEQLLTHTSGMPNYANNLPFLIDMCNPAASWKPADILNNVAYLPHGATGTFRYSNTNYILLGMIAESKGGAALNMLLANTFFTPLSITALLAPQDTYPAGIAHGYDDAFALGSPSHTFMDYDAALKVYVNSTYDFFLGIGRVAWAAGGIIATAADLATWGHELYDDTGAAITPTVRTQLKNSAPHNGDYGYGVTYYDFTYTDSTVGGYYGHGGDAPGYRALLIYEKNKAITIAIMTNVNNSGTDPGHIVDVYALAEDILNAY